MTGRTVTARHGWRAFPAPRQELSLAAGARWCPVHGRAECGKHRHGGVICHGLAVTGTAACRMHLGVRPDSIRGVRPGGAP